MPASSELPRRGDVQADAADRAGRAGERSPAMRWSPADCEGVAPPAIAAALLRRGIEASPDNPVLLAKLAGVQLSRYDFEGAAANLEAALRLRQADCDLRLRLAGVLNVLGRHEEALDLLAADPLPRHDRGLALEALGRAGQAEAEYRAVLKDEPHDRVACRKLCRMLRGSGRRAELLETCEGLHGRGVRHTQLVSDWGIALALNGKAEAARAILVDRGRIREVRLPVPEGWDSLESFNAALAGEILANPYPVSDVPTPEAANRGSSRVHHLLAGKAPAMIRALLRTLERVVEAEAPPRRGPFDPWAEARPRAARLQAWGLVQRSGDYEEWHIHRDGWLSGVYYVQVPGSVSAEAEGRGCIEYGPPSAVARAAPGLVAVQRYRPSEGMLLLAPSHYPHRTIPTGAPTHRISFAFDVVPDEGVSPPEAA
ncbi:MAG TPA: putative 2OG-Fe(II) oxygenase [Allosphingosinicella sp.]|jgi:tetratricopeptide (TPR) repeat protein